MNRNADATQDFLAGSIPLAKTRDERISAAQRAVTGGQQLVKFLIERAQKSIALGNKNEAILFRNEAEAARQVIKVNMRILEEAEAEQIGVAMQKRWPTFFERREIHQTAIALHKTDEIVLADKANLAVQSRADRRAWKNQKRNANIDPATQSLDSLLNTGADRNLVNEKSQCARHCNKDGVDIQGRSNCPYCQGAGFNAARKIKEGK